MIELAQQIAKTVLDYSHPSHQIEGILLFGSTLTGQRYHPEKVIPSDIDMVIIHRAGSLAEFDWDKYGENKDICDQPIGRGNNRTSSWRIAYNLGSRDYPTYDSIFNPEHSHPTEKFSLEISKEVLAENGLVLEDKFDSVVFRESTHISGPRTKVISAVAIIVAYKELRNVDLYHNSEDFKRLLTTMGKRFEERKVQVDQDMVYKRIEGLLPPELDFDKAFDLHTLDARLLSRKLQERDLPYKFEPDKERSELCQKKCQDPTFWNTVLSTGRLFDGERFTIPVEDRYPGCLELFPH